MKNQTRKHRSINPIFDAKRDRWKVNVPPSMSESGKKLRLWFKTRIEARNYCDKITDQTAPSPAISSTVAVEADKARGILEPWKLDLVQAAREVAAALEALGDAGSILEAAKAYRAVHDARSGSKPFGEAVTLYLSSREDLRDSTQKSYKYTLEKAFASLHGETMADITTADVESILTGKGPTSRRMHTRNLKAFWKWATMKPRQWATMDAVSDLEAVRGSSDADIEILKPAEVKALLHAAEAEGNGAAAAYAIAVFGGVRMAELGKLTWGDVGEDTIEIGKAISKKHSRRLVPVCPTLRAWMDATRGKSKDEDTIVPPNWVDVSKSVRRRAGWNVAARLLESPPKATRGEWPINACRHTCASVQVAIGTPLDDLTFKFGHSGGHDLLRKHYVSRLTKKSALEILSIGPAGSKVSNIAAA